MSEKREFFYRRLHSLLGVVPVGVFLIVHLTVNHFAAYGEESFNNAVHFMESLPFLILLQLLIIYLPIIFHAVLGVYIALTARNNAKRYGFLRNWLFLFQRISGIITLIFLVWHVWETRIAAALGNTEISFDMMEDVFSNPFMIWFYIIGLLSTTFHFANGLWSFLVSWGIIVSPRSQQITTYVTIIVFIALSYMGIRSILAFAMGA
ncbi:succinate dehydrogenase cytochrome b558 subunit [Radiobacillus kanasensis]|uniref:succinate dehydrogenase cytochrome b558 subunit n=1 Tax=Radiobacillus kanasensis TaxID=2844358 RepID=UPI001E557921|nr:succinate dehydrogenase cytochrome b558 subunit [Radiobacillus kanasensis]UFT97972.1 succinate dehydrogenase cytochrome b558 subunit [Radiobacillus kanasensis]